jgi:hypothetical protein
MAAAVMLNVRMDSTQPGVVAANSGIRAGRGLARP